MPRAFLSRVGLVSSVLSLVLLVAPAGAQGPDPDRYVVSFNEDGPGRAALARAGAQVLLELPSQGAVAARIPAQALNGLRRNPNIEYVERDVLRFALAETTPYGITRVQADQITYDASPGRTVCIIDSGYSFGHEDLPNDQVTASPDPGTGDPYVDLSGHGTHVAGTIAALSNGVGVVGVVPGGTVRLHIVKVFGDDGAWAYSSTLVAAVDKCIGEGGANVISMSLGGSFKSRTEQRAFGAAYNQGVLSIAAAGNDGNRRKSYPASYDSVVSVAATDSADQIASFSQQNDQVELAAPGVAVRSTVTPFTGTDESLEVAATSYEAIAMEGSPDMSGSGALFRCNAVDGLGSPGDCVGASDRVCLISRGSITFAEKVVECQTQGGVGAVIFNDSPALFSGTLGETATAIPSVGVSGDDGAVLETLTGSASTVTTQSGGHYAYFDGTSMATPHVSGVATLVWSQDATCSNQEVRDALTISALDLGAPGRDDAFGFGLVQAADAAAALSCGGGGGGGCELLPVGASCTVDSECCSNKCKGRAGAKTCK